MTHKFKDKSLSGLQKKKLLPARFSVKFVMLPARSIPLANWFACVSAGMGRAYLFTPYWKYMDQSIKYPILFSQNFINVYCRGSRRQKNIFILNNSLTSIPLKTIYILKVPLKENLDSWNYSIYKYKFWFGPSEICPSSVF